MGAGRYKQHRKNSRHKDGGIECACDGCRKIHAAQEEQSSLGWWNRVCVRWVQEDTSSTGRTVVTRMVE